MDTHTIKMHVTHHLRVICFLEPHLQPCCTCVEKDASERVDGLVELEEEGGSF